MAAMGLTEIDATRQALIASIVLETLKQKSVLLPTVTDYSRFAVKGAKSVGVPRRAQFAAADKSENTDLLKQEMLFSTDVIELSKHKAIFAELERIAGLQATPDVVAEIVKEMALELALQVDKDLYAQLKLASAAAPDHRVAFAGATLAKSDILNARKLLNIQNVSTDARWLLLNPLHEKELLEISEFIEVDKYGPGAQPLATGELGRVFGFRVLMSNVVEDLNVVAYHQEAVAYANQLAPQFETDKNLANVADQYLMHHIYGCKVMDSGKRQVLIGTAA